MTSHPTDIIRRRRARAAHANRRTARLLRLGAGLVLASGLAAVLALALATATGSAVALAFLRDLPDAAALAELPTKTQPSPASGRIIAIDPRDPAGSAGPLLLDTIHDPRPPDFWVAYDDLPPLLVSATLAVEDPAYWTAAPPRLEQAVGDWLRDGRTAQPLSPLVTSLVTAELRDGRPPADARSAAQDWLLGWHLSRTTPRETVVEWLLNTRYYGHLAYGVEAASQLYFAKPAAALSLGEAALLAGIGRDPAANPFDNPAAARRAQADVLAAMMQQRRATANATIYAQQTPLHLAPPPGSDSLAPHFAALVRRELESRLGPEALLAADFTATTTFDPAAQTALETLDPALSGAWAALTLDPTGGAVLAAAGEPGPAPGLPTTTPRPSGALLRPLAALAALSQGYSAASGLLDTAEAYETLDRPLPPGETTFAGPLRLREAAAGGATGPALQLMRWAGPTALARTTAALGLPAVFPAPGALETAEGGPASLLSVAGAFGALANGGALAGTPGENAAALPRPTTLRDVVDAGGTVLYRSEAVERPIITAPLAWLLNDILGDGPHRDESSNAVELAAVADGGQWRIAYRPEQLLALWTAVDAPLPVDLAPLLAGETPALWPRPTGLVERAVCDLSGLLPPRSPNGRSLCPTVDEWFIPGAEPTTVDDWHQTVAINRANGRLATIFTPPRLVEEREVLVLPPDAQAWAAATDLPLPPAELDGIGRLFTRRGDAAAVTSPVPFETVGGTVRLLGTAAGDRFSAYRVTVFPGLQPTAMSLLLESETPVVDGELAAWDSTAVPDGLHTLLLSVIRTDGTLVEVAIPVTVANGAAGR